MDLDGSFLGFSIWEAFWTNSLDAIPKRPDLSLLRQAAIARRIVHGIHRRSGVTANQYVRDFARQLSEWTAQAPPEGALFFDEKGELWLCYRLSLNVTWRVHVPWTILPVLEIILTREERRELARVHFQALIISKERAAIQDRDFWARLGVDTHNSEDIISDDEGYEML